MPPEGVGSMSLQDAITHMWEVLDKGNRVEWGEDGFTLDLQSKGRQGQDCCAEPMFNHVNRAHPFWSSPVTVAFIALLDNYEHETGVAEARCAHRSRSRSTCSHSTQSPPLTPLSALGFGFHQVVTTEEKREMAVFLDALAATKVMRFAFEYLKVGTLPTPTLQHASPPSPHAMPAHSDRPRAPALSPPSAPSLPLSSNGEHAAAAASRCTASTSGAVGCTASRIGSTCCTSSGWRRTDASTPTTRLASSTSSWGRRAAARSSGCTIG
eukprot:6499027-Prymnesium_polylepis.1